MLDGVVVVCTCRVQWLRRLFQQRGETVDSTAQRTPVQEMKSKAPQKKDAVKKQLQNGAIEKRKSKYVGVSWSSASGKWHATLTHKGVSRSLGYFPADKEKEAAQCYDKVARKLRGKKAKVNFPRAGEAKGAPNIMRTAEQIAQDKALVVHFPTHL